MLLVACSIHETVPTNDQAAETTDNQIARAEATTTRPASPDPAARAPVANNQPAPPPADAAARASATPAPSGVVGKTSVPARFAGSWAPDATACKSRDGFERITIKADRIDFFETVGEVQKVFEKGGSTRITVKERVGDAHPVYDIMVSLADGGRALNYINRGKRHRYVKCAG